MHVRADRPAAPGIAAAPGESKTPSLRLAVLVAPVLQQSAKAEQQGAGRKDSRRAGMGERQREERGCAQKNGAHTRLAGGLALRLTVRGLARRPRGFGAPREIADGFGDRLEKRLRSRPDLDRGLRPADSERLAEGLRDHALGVFNNIFDRAHRKLAGGQDHKIFSETLRGKRANAGAGLAKAEPVRRRIATSAAESEALPTAWLPLEQQYDVMSKKRDCAVDGKTYGENNLGFRHP